MTRINFSSSELLRILVRATAVLSAGSKLLH